MLSHPYFMTRQLSPDFQISFIQDCTSPALRLPHLYNLHDHETIEE